MNAALATRSLPTIALLTALGLIAVSAAPVVWHWRGDFALPVGAGPAAPQAAVEALPPADIGPVLALAPFGAQAEIEAPQAPMGETTLDLTLLGVIVAQDPDQSRAMIANGQKTAQYRAKEQITDRAVLIEVAGDHVVLEVDGTLQTLSFPVPGAKGTAKAAPSGTERLLAAVSAGAVAAKPETTTDYIDLWRDRIKANPGEVLSAIGLVPTADGYLIAEQHDSGVQKAGLRAGDLVRSVNGKPVGNVEQDRKYYDEVAASGTARIEIERDGQTIVMTFPLQ